MSNQSHGGGGRLEELSNEKERVSENCPIRVRGSEHLPIRAGGRRAGGVDVALTGQISGPRRRRAGTALGNVWEAVSARGRGWLDRHNRLEAAVGLGPRAPP